MSIFKVFKNKPSTQSALLPGDATKTIFLYWAQNGKKISNDQDYYPRYFKQTYNITDCAKYHRKLVSEGYFTKPDILSILNTLKINQLKDILEELNLSKTGKKAELISRIMGNAPKERLNTIVGNFEGFVLSDIAKTYLAQNEDYIKFHKNSYGFELQDYENAKKKCRDARSYEDIIWGMLNEQLLRSYKNKEIGLLRNIYFNMASLLKKEAKNVDSLYYFIVVLYFDIHTSNQYAIESYKWKTIKAEELKDFYTLPTLAPGICSEIKNLKNFYDAYLIERCYKDMLLPYATIPVDDFAMIIGSILDTGTCDIEKYDCIIFAALRKSCGLA